METLKQALDHWFVGEPLIRDGLRIHPVFPGRAPASNLQYLVLDDALKTEQVSVREREPASVPHLVVENRSQQAVLALDGQQLHGGKQDRMLTTSILLAAGTTTEVPVCCVEKGRWHPNTTHFSAGHSGHASVRRMSHHAVSQHVRSHGSHQTDQHGVWGHLASGHQSHGSHSRTGAMRDLHARRDAELQQHVDALPYPSGAVGAVAVGADGAMAIDIFDQPATAARYWSRLVRSYAWDTAAPYAAAPAFKPEDVLRRAAQAEFSTHASPGTGVDIRIQGGVVSGSALCQADGQPVHVRLFVEPAALKPHVLDSNPLVMAIPNFLSPQECRDYIVDGEARGFRFAPITTASGPVDAPDIRNNDRVMFDDVELAARLWDRVRPYVPAELDGWKAVGLNERFRFYRYQAGQRFAPHYDGSYQRRNGECSQLTLMLYLNDGFEGGQTRFYNAYEEKRFAVKPLEGAALIFLHEQLHEGAVLTRGVKYVLRTDIMYRQA